MDSGAQMEFVPRLRVKLPVSTSPTSRARSSSPRTSASPRAIRANWKSGTTHISVPEDFLIGRVVARNIVDATPAKSSPRPTTS